MNSFGPMVHRSARTGGILLALASIQFIVAMVVVQLRYPGYTDFGNYVSDLGNTVTSPWYWLFNDSIRVLAVLGILGTLLIRTAYPRKTIARGGLLFLLIAELGAFAVGSFPENVNGPLHGAASSVTFIAAGLALLLLGVGTFRDTRWEGYRGYTFLSGVVTFVAIGLFQADPGGMALVGLWERLIIAPILLWAILAGSHLVRLPTFAPAKAVT
jgi:hypothetical membrane protein